MAVLVKLLIVIFSFVIGIEHVQYDNLICSIASFLMCGYFIVNLHKQFIHYINDEWTYSDSLKNNSFSLKNWDNVWDSKSSFSDYSSFDYGSYNKTIIKKIEKNFKNKKHNFIEFCDEPKFLVGKKDKNKMILNNSKSKKPKFDFKKVLANVESNEKRNNKLDGADVIMIANDSKVDNIRKTVYEAIIETLDSDALSPNERYALFQSFFYVDICPTSVVIYVDKTILEKAHLTEVSLHKDKIDSAIKKALYFPDMEIQFVELNHVNLLNYYLK